MLLDVEDDLGNGTIILQYVLAVLLAQTNRHAIHYYAIIGYILDRLDVKVEDKILFIIRYRDDFKEYKSELEY